MLKIIGASGRLAKKYNLSVGDSIVAFEGFPAEDSLDYLFYDANTSFKVTLQRKDGSIEDVLIKKREGESLNLTFEEDQKIRTCHNNCKFCFVDQMPKGMRDSLYIKDDDYVMSFMCGNFVTLTNLSDEQLERIIRLKLSPLYISVHSMNEQTRCALMNNRFAGKIVNQLKRLTDARIKIHCQIVVVPELNDGADLEYTARELFKMHPYVLDMAVVPTGLTKYRDNLPKIDNISKQSAQEMLDLCKRLNGEFGVNFILPADEYYIKAERPFESVEFYGDFAQIENGIGMTTKFIDDFNFACHKTQLKNARRVAVVCGTSVAQTMQTLLDRANENVQGLTACALPVVNNFFGDSVTCTGLLTGGDILMSLQKNADRYEVAIIPANTLREFEDVFLDGMTIEELCLAIPNKKIIVNRSAEDFFQTLISID